MPMPIEATLTHPLTAACEPWPDVATARRFLSGLAAGVPIPCPIPPDDLAAWAQQHGLGPLVSSCYPGQLPQLQADYFSAVAEQALMKSLLQEIVAAAGRVEVPLLLLKGAALAETVYADAAQRPMTDIDIWVPAGDVARLVGALLAAGWQSLTLAPDRPPALQAMGQGELQLARPGWVNGLVEVHWSPFVGWWQQRTTNIDNAGLWARREPLPMSPALFQLAPEDTVLHLAFHVAVNHQFSLSAVRSLLDLALTVRHRPVQWPVVWARAQAWRMATVLWLALALAVALVDLPAEVLRWHPAGWRQRALARLVNPQTILAGSHLSAQQARYALLLLLVDRPRDAAGLLGRTLWPEPEWLLARYGAAGQRWHHLWQVVRYGQI